MFRDAEDELDWIREKEPLASSTNRGRDLIGVQNLIKKQQALETELDNKQDRIDDVMSAGQAMVDREHFAADDIKTKASIDDAVAWLIAFLGTCGISAKMDTSG